jgi:hypothetical protein
MAYLWSLRPGAPLDLLVNVSPSKVPSSPGSACFLNSAWVYDPAEFFDRLTDRMETIRPQIGQIHAQLFFDCN